VTFSEWPDGYEEVEYLAKMLKQYDMTYFTHVEQKEYPLNHEYVVVITRWEGATFGGLRRGLRRTLLTTFDDVSEATGMLRLLIGNAKEGVE
jgi:hypothetical protein